MSAYSRQSKGFSLVEVMIALVLGLIVMAAMGAMFLSSKRTYSATESLSRLQERARFGSQFVARELRMAGYSGTYESSESGTGPVRQVLFTGSSPFAAGQILAGDENNGGTGGVKAGTDVIRVRYGGSDEGSVRNCVGDAVAAAGAEVMTLFVSSNNDLACRVGTGAATTLVDGVSDMQVTYGIDSDGDRFADSYSTATAVTNWARVSSVRVALTAAPSANSGITPRPVVAVVALRNELP